MHWIPDVPKIIEDQIERENLITQRALWEAKPEIIAPPVNFESLLTDNLQQHNSRHHHRQTDDDEQKQADNNDNELKIELINPTS
jgi:hypothetical protein